MLKYLFKRILLAIITLLFLTTIVYLLVASFSKNPFASAADPSFAQEQYEANGLDWPILIRFFSYLGDFFTHGSFGKIYVPQGGEVPDSIPLYFFSSLKWSLLITIPALFFSLVIGMILGVIAGYKRGTWIDGLINIFVVTFVGLPSFIIAPLIILIAVSTNGAIIFEFQDPSINGWWLTLKSLALPILTVTLGSLAQYTILTRNQMVTILSSNHVLIARSKGLNNWEIFTKHIIRNISIPILNYLLPSFVYLLAGNVIIEQFFRIPGASNVIIQSFPNGEINIVMFFVIFLSVLSLLMQIILDFSAVLIDPRIRYVEENRTDFILKSKNYLIRKKTLFFDKKEQKKNKKIENLKGGYSE